MTSRLHQFKSGIRGTTEPDRRSIRIEKDIELRKSRRYQYIANKRTKFIGEDLDEDLTAEQLEELFIQHDRNEGSARPDVLKQLAKALENPTDAIAQFVMKGKGMNLVMNSLSSTNTEEHFPAVWVVINMSATLREDLVENSFTFLPFLQQFLSTNIKELQTLSVWCIGNIAAHSIGFRDRLRAMGAIPSVIKMLDTTNIDLLRNSTFALFNLMKGENPNIGHFTQLGLATLLSKHIKQHYDEVTKMELWNLVSYMTSVDLNIRSTFHKHGLISAAAADLEALLSLLSTSPESTTNVTALLPIIRYLGTYSSSSERKHNIWILEITPIVSNLLFCTMIPSKAIKKEALWVLSNITTLHEAKKKFAAESVQILLNGLQNPEVDWESKLEIAYILLNLAANDISYLSNMVNLSDLIPPFRNLLLSTDTTAVTVSLHFFGLLISAISTKKVQSLENSHLQLVIEYVTNLALSSMNEDVMALAVNVLAFVTGQAEEKNPGEDEMET